MKENPNVTKPNTKLTNKRCLNYLTTKSSNVSNKLSKKNREIVRKIRSKTEKNLSKSMKISASLFKSKSLDKNINEVRAEKVEAGNHSLVVDEQELSGHEPDLDSDVSYRGEVKKKINRRRRKKEESSNESSKEDESSETYTKIKTRKLSTDEDEFCKPKIVDSTEIPVKKKWNRRKPENIVSCRYNIRRLSSSSSSRSVTPDIKKDTDIEEKHSDSSQTAPLVSKPNLIIRDCYVRLNRLDCKYESYLKYLKQLEEVSSEKKIECQGKSEWSSSPSYNTPKTSSFSKKLVNIVITVGNNGRTIKNASPLSKPTPPKIESKLNKEIITSPTSIVKKSELTVKLPEKRKSQSLKLQRTNPISPVLIKKQCVKNHKSIKSNLMSDNKLHAETYVKLNPVTQEDEDKYFEKNEPSELSDDFPMSENEAFLNTSKCLSSSNTSLNSADSNDSKKRRFKSTSLLIDDSIETDDLLSKVYKQWNNGARKHFSRYENEKPNAENYDKPDTAVEDRHSEESRDSDLDRSQGSNVKHTLRFSMKAKRPPIMPAVKEPLLKESDAFKIPLPPRQRCVCLIACNRSYTLLSSTPTERRRIHERTV